MRAAVGAVPAEDLPQIDRAPHIALGLLAHFYSSAAAQDLCYEARIGKGTCRPLTESPKRPLPLKHPRLIRCPASWSRATSASSAPASAPRWWPRSSRARRAERSSSSKPATKRHRSRAAPRCGAATSSTARARGPTIISTATRSPAIQSRSMQVGGLAMHWGGVTPRFSPGGLQDEVAVRRRHRLADLLRRSRSVVSGGRGAARRRGRAGAAGDGPAGEAVPHGAAAAHVQPEAAAGVGRQGRHPDVEPAVGEELHALRRAPRLLPQRYLLPGLPHRRQVLARFHLGRAAQGRSGSG